MRFVIVRPALAHNSSPTGRVACRPQVITERRLGLGGIVAHLPSLRPEHRAPTTSSGPAIPRQYRLRKVRLVVLADFLVVAPLISAVLVGVVVRRAFDLVLRHVHEDL